RQNVVAEIQQRQLNIFSLFNQRIRVLSLSQRDFLPFPSHSVNNGNEQLKLEKCSYRKIPKRLRLLSTWQSSIRGHVETKRASKHIWLPLAATIGNLRLASVSSLQTA